MLMPVFERGVRLAVYLVALQKSTNEFLDLAHLERACIVRVDSIVNIFGHFLKLLQVDENVSEILNSLLVVDLGVDARLSICLICHYNFY